MDIQKIAKDLVTPISLIAIIAVIRLFAEQLIPVSNLYTELSPLAALLVPMFLAIKFKHYSVFYFIFSCLLIFSAVYALNYNLLRLMDNQISEATRWLVILLPLNLLLLKIFRTPGLITTSSQLFLGIILLETGFIYWIASKDSYDIFSFILEPQLALPFSFGDSMSQLAALLFLLVFVVQLIVLLFRNSAIQANLLGAILILAIAVNYIELPHMLTLCILGLGIMLSIGVTQDSHDMAFLDTLTQMPGRRSMEQELKQLGKRYVIAMLDIDHFKKLNDRYGHDVGDQVLKMVARSIKRVSGGGKPARYGGEEFAIIFSGKSLPEVIPHLEAVRLQIEKTPFYLRDKSRPKKIPKQSNHRPSKSRQSIHVTISMGAAESNRVNRSPNSVMKAADKALYRAKRQGRNQVCY